MPKNSAKWKDGKVAVIPDSDTKGFKFPGTDVIFAKPAPAAVRRKRADDGKRPVVVRRGFRESTGTATAITVSQETLEKLGCNDREAVEYKKASIWNIFCAKKTSVLLASLGFLVLAAQAVSYLTPLIPAADQHDEKNLLWLLAIVTLVGALLVTLITTMQASSDS